MLGRNYISINSQTIPNPTGVSISETNVETIKTAENGKDVGDIQRLGKQTINFTFDCTSGGRDKIRAYCLLTSVSLTFNGTNYTGRLRIKDQKLFKGSEYCRNTDGLWTISVSFIEE